MSNIIQSARKFAEFAHRGQIRKYTEEPYINHPIAVAKLVLFVASDNYTIAAALLHDVVEDTEFTISDISKEFGRQIAKLVDDLTDISKSSDGNRKIRKEIDREHTFMASPTAKTIKLADLLDNSINIIKYDPKFATVYMAEKKAFLGVLKEGHPYLWKKADIIVQNYYTKGKTV